MKLVQSIDKTQANLANTSAGSIRCFHINRDKTERTVGDRFEVVKSVQDIPKLACVRLCLWLSALEGIKLHRLSFDVQKPLKPAHINAPTTRIIKLCDKA